MRPIAALLALVCAAVALCVVQAVRIVLGTSPSRRYPLLDTRT